jgi:damage-control phosphatase, subfamily II, stand-alone protein
VVGIFEGLLDDLAAGGADDVSTVHAVTQIREQLLRCHGLYDPYFHTKRRQAQQYLPMAMELLEEAWAAGGAANGNRRDHLALLLTRLLAGNLFDLGSQATQEAFRDGHLDPIASAAEFREEVIDWLSGQPAEAIEPWMPCPREVGLPAQGRVLLLADNAGPDFLLGILPVALYLARRWEVWVVANTHPASSDITYQEACTLLDQLAQAPASAARQAIRAGRLRLLASGTGSPGIDLRHVGAPLCAVAEDAAWLLIDGQGRGVETNWDTRFSVPVYRMAVVKDPWVAERIGRPAGRPLLRWDPPA